MNSIVGRVFLAMVAVAFACMPQPARAGAISVFNTGVDGSGNLLGDGAVDPHYSLVVSADPAYPGPDAVTINNANYPLGNSPDWLPNGPDSRWIGPRADPSRTEGNAAGEYIYRTTFDIVGIDPALVHLTGQWITDNSGSILLDGVATGITRSNDFMTFSPFTITGGFVTGTNTLDFVVNNDGGPTGLRVELSASTVPEPSSLALAVIGGLIGIRACRRRHRPTA
jgi:hypothetical protein